MNQGRNSGGSHGHHRTTNGGSTMEIGQSNQDLLLSKSKRKKRIWLIVSVVGAIVVALIITAIVLLTKGSSDQDADEATAESINLEDFLTYKYNPESFNGTWVSGNKFLYKNPNGNLVLYDVTLESGNVLLDASDDLLLNSFEYKLSADEEYLLVARDYQKLYRNSFRARYTILNLSTNVRTVLKADDTITGMDFFLVEWAPVGHALVYVYKNNIFYMSAPESDQVIPITETNETEFVFNGIPDWVYEEEVFGSNKALWFSDDGTKLAFVRFNDTRVEAMVVPIYGEPGSLYFQYPRANLIKYPKAGTPNPTVTLLLYDFSNSSLNELTVPTELETMQPILTSIKWATNNSLIAIWTNRVQNRADIVVYENLSNTPTLIKSVIESSGWVDLFVPPHTSNVGTQMALLLSNNVNSTVGSYRHLAILDITQGDSEEFLTEGTYVVTEVLGWNSLNNLIYYTATDSNDSSIQHVYSVSPTSKAITCLSCSLKSKNGDNDCTYNSAEMSKDFSYLVLICNGPSIPDISIVSTESGRILQWTTNEDLATDLAGISLPVKEKFEFPIADGFTAKVMLKLPPNLDRSGNTKYPMLVNVYGGPDTYQVTNKFSIDWGSYLAANKSIIYATIDGRGSGLRGNNLLFAGYRKLGTVEVVDQVNVTRLIQESLPYVDASRTAIWGWSYGGYASGMALAIDTENVFKCGISVAPVTDWALYDSIYTERFMGLPLEDDNLAGYKEAQLLQKYAGLKGKRYFLIHGTFDDNVHYQQSMMWAKTLERNDILFRQLSYPDEDHSLLGVRPHLYHSLENFLNECFA